MRTRDEHLFGPGPKRILSLDGGGVRGLATLGMLRSVEATLRARVRPELRETFRLSDYFDLIGGTSTGGLIASLLALGYSVEAIVAIYLELAPKVFGKSRWLQGIKAKFDSRALQTVIDDILGQFLKSAGGNPKDLPVLRFDTELLRTGLALVTKRIDRGSVWILTNNPKTKYWDPKAPQWEAHFKSLGRARDFYPNRDYQLATIIRASASAPFYLDGIGLDISENEHGHFLDGGVSPFNNPAQELFLMTTLKSHGPHWHPDGVSPYGFGWETGADKLMLLSLGTGEWRLRIDAREFERRNMLSQTGEALLSIIDDANVSANTWLQALSENPKAATINGNLEQMHNLRIVNEPLLSFRRLSPRIEADWLTKLDAKFDFTTGEIAKTRELDHSAKANLERLLAIGTATGTREIDADDFPAVFDIPEMQGVRLFA